MKRYIILFAICSIFRTGFAAAQEIPGHGDGPQKIHAYVHAHINSREKLGNLLIGLAGSPESDPHIIDELVCLMKNQWPTQDIQPFGTVALHEATEVGHRTCIKALLKHKITNVDAKHAGHAPLITAARDGDYATLGYLISKGADINTLDENGRTPLMWACHESREFCCRILLSADADINIVDKFGCTAGSQARTPEILQLFSNEGLKK